MVYLLWDGGETESFNKWASFSCSHGEVYPHLSQHLTPGREGVSAKAKGQHLSHCNLEPTWTPNEHCGQRETQPGWFFRATDVWTEQELCFEVAFWKEAFERDSSGFLIKWRTNNCPALLRLFCIFNGADTNRKQSCGWRICRCAWMRVKLLEGAPPCEKTKKSMWHSRGRSVWEQI